MVLSQSQIHEFPLSDSGSQVTVVSGLIVVTKQGGFVSLIY